MYTQISTEVVDAYLWNVIVGKTSSKYEGNATDLLTFRQEWISAIEKYLRTKTVSIWETINAFLKVNSSFDEDTLDELYMNFYNQRNLDYQCAYDQYCSELDTLECNLIKNSKCEYIFIELLKGKLEILIKWEFKNDTTPGWALSQMIELSIMALPLLTPCH